MLNQVVLMGNLVRDPEVKSLPSGTAVCEFTVAANDRYTTKDGQEREETLFMECKAFGRKGEVIAQYFSGGKPIIVTGRLKQEKWVDKASGGNRSKIVLNVEDFQFLPKNEGNLGGGKAPAQQDSGRKYDPATDDDIPF